MSQASLRQPEPGEAPPLTRWRCWPLRTHPILGAMLIWTWVAIVIGIQEWTEQAHLAAIAGLALGISLWRFFVPVVFELNVDGIHQWVLGRHRLLPWKSVECYELLEDGVLLLPFADRCLLDILRGLYLPWGAHREEVLANLRYHLAAISPRSVDS